ncbi:MAG: PD-(D/E)XK nuclease family protein [Desulfuromonadales bacterium]
MIPTDAMETDILAWAASGALVLTATKRLARRLRRQFDAQQVTAGHRVWVSPAIASGDAWLQQAADVLGEGWRLLGTPQARMVWEKIIAADAAGAARELLQTGSTARSAEEAHALLDEYGGDPAAWPLTADHESFLRWRRAYLELRRQEGWLDRPALVAKVAAAIAQDLVPTPSQVLLVGFDELPPRFLALAEAMTACGRAVRVLSPPAEPRGLLQRLPCADARDEVRRAACWARTLLATGEEDIGIVVPNLENYRALIDRIFREEIDPAAQVHPGGEENRFNLSLGTPLAGKGAIAAALAILAAETTLALPEAGFLLRTPYLGGSVHEATARARLDRHLRAGGAAEVNLARLQSLAQQERAPFAAAIFRHLAAATHDRISRLPGAWGSRFAAILQEVGWPGERPLDSLDFQAIKAFREKVLSQLAAFDPISGPVRRSEALALLRRLAVETEFQPEGPESPIQVVGILEAAGLRFRHLWVMGLHDGALPAAPRPNPFLPAALQSAAGMPHADADREAVFARKVADRLFAAAPQVILSHPQREGDATLLPSPLIGALLAADLAIAPSLAPRLLWRQNAPPHEEIADAAGPALAPGERTRGGTAILRDQALCPFRAFVRHRLGVVALEVPDIGLDSRERGNLLHKVMEIFWAQTKTQRELLTLTGAERQQRIDESFAGAVQALYPAGRTHSQPVLLELEKARLRLLIGEWLDQVEARRTSFTVLEQEKECTETFGGMAFTTRIDRIDRLEDGRLVVLDYKTGQMDAADLIGDRLIEPQLPIYGLGAESASLAAVAFAGMRRGKCAFQGIAVEADVLPKVPAFTAWKKGEELGIEWPELLHRWRRQLDALARSFAEGEAGVDPVGSEKACRFCDYASFCRRGDAAVENSEGGDA